jgi:hypothetical protein
MNRFRPIPRSKTETIHGDAHLTVFIDINAFLKEEDSPEEEIPERPDEGQCQ